MGFEKTYLKNVEEIMAKLEQIGFKIQDNSTAMGFSLFNIVCSEKNLSIMGAIIPNGNGYISITRSNKLKHPKSVGRIEEIIEPYKLSEIEYDKQKIIK